MTQEYCHDAVMCTDDPACPAGPHNARQANCVMGHHPDWDWQKLYWQMLLMKRLLLFVMMKKPMFLLLGLASLLQPSCAYRDPALALPRKTADLLLPQPPLFPAPCPLPVSSKMSFVSFHTIASTR